MTAPCTESTLLTEWRRWINVGLADGTLRKANGGVDVRYVDMTAADETWRTYKPREAA